MDRRLFDGLVPGLYAIAIVVTLVADGPVGAVAIVGAMLVGLYYGVVRRSLVEPTGGRQRNRDRNRDRAA